MKELCPVCSSQDMRDQSAYRGRDAVFVGLRRAQCQACGMVFACPMPDEERLKRYNASYFDSAHGGQPRNHRANAFFSGIARLRMAHIERYLNQRNISGSSLLEFGPGVGFFAQNWLRTHPATAYHACETDRFCHDILRKTGVTLIAPSGLTGYADTFDLVVMSHVLEHVPGPVGFLSEAAKTLRKGGVLFIEVPCRDFEHKSLDEPHLLFFDKVPMEHLLRRVGFGDVEVGYHGQDIARLRSAYVLRRKALAVRSKLIALGVVWPFGRMRRGLEAIADPLERAAVAPFEAHREKERPAWWLRAVARKE